MALSYLSELDSSLSRVGEDVGFRMEPSSFIPILYVQI